MSVTGLAVARESDRRELVAALGMAPDTSWLDALTTARRVFAEFAGPAELVGAKGCHGCRYAIGERCGALLDDAGVGPWQGDHLEDDLMTPKPGAPECPGRAER